MNKEYDEKERNEFRTNPKALVAHAKDIEDQVNGLWGAFYAGTEAAKAGAEWAGGRMAEFIKDKRLLEGFTPKFGVGCRRITPGDPYMIAIQEPNVDVHFTGVASCTEDGIVGDDGEERKVDTIVCATGFDVSYRPRFPIVGKGGIDLKVCIHTSDLNIDTTNGYTGQMEDLPRILPWPRHTRLPQLHNLHRSNLASRKRQRNGPSPLSLRLRNKHNQKDAKREHLFLVPQTRHNRFLQLPRPRMDQTHSLERRL